MTCLSPLGHSFRVGNNFGESVVEWRPGCTGAMILYESRHGSKKYKISRVLKPGEISDVTWITARFIPKGTWCGNIQTIELTIDAFFFLSFDFGKALGEGGECWIESRHWREPASICLLKVIECAATEHLKIVHMCLTAPALRCLHRPEMMIPHTGPTSVALESCLVTAESWACLLALIGKGMLTKFELSYTKWAADVRVDPALFSAALRKCRQLKYLRLGYDGKDAFSLCNIVTATLEADGLGYVQLNGKKEDTNWTGDEEALTRAFHARRTPISTLELHIRDSELKSVVSNRDAAVILRACRASSAIRSLDFGSMECGDESVEALAGHAIDNRNLCGCYPDFDTVTPLHVIQLAFFLQHSTRLRHIWPWQLKEHCKHLKWYVDFMGRHAKWRAPNEIFYPGGDFDPSRLHLNEKKHSYIARHIYEDVPSCARTGVGMPVAIVQCVAGPDIPAIEDVEAVAIGDSDCSVCFSDAFIRGASKLRRLALLNCRISA